MQSILQSTLNIEALLLVILNVWWLSGSALILFYRFKNQSKLSQIIRSVIFALLGLFSGFSQATWQFLSQLHLNGNARIGLLFSLIVLNAAINGFWFKHVLNLIRFIPDIKPSKIKQIKNNEVNINGNFTSSNPNRSN